MSLRSATRPLTLDEVLAFEVHNNQQEYDLLRTTLDAFINNADFDGTSIGVQVVPAAKGLQSWLRLFPVSAQGNRLEGAIKARVCYAERGMFYLLVLIDAVEAQLGMLQKQVQTPEVKQFQEQLKGFMRTVLGCDRRGLTLMRNWLSTLVDIVPLDQRSPHTPLTTRNVIERLNLFCE